MFGHAKIYTTQIYIQVSIRGLKDVHVLRHPAKLDKDDRSEDEIENED